jgi:release factor glutamine methyltransferase
MTLTQAFRDIQKRLTPVAGDCALPEAERILTFLLNCSRAELYLSKPKELPAGTKGKILAVVQRRLKHEPLAHILGSAYFYDREFVVTPDVIIPRPDTEILVEEVLKNEKAQSCRFLDMGTGSGCIAAILTEHNPGWKAVASDVSYAALKIAKKNCPESVKLLCCDRLSSVKNRARFDFIVTNPPYIKTPVLATLEKSVRSFEPFRALDGGPDGLDFYRFFADDAKPLLRDGGRIYCEIGFDQGDDVPAVFENSGWKNISATNDLGNRPRVLRAVKQISLKD